MLFKSIGVDELIFQSRNCVKRSRRRKIGGIEIAVNDCLFYTFGLVGIVVYAEVWGDAGNFGISAENADAQGVKGANMRASGRGESECPLSHFVGGLVGKSDGADIISGDT